MRARKRTIGEEGDERVGQRAAAAAREDVVVRVRTRLGAGLPVQHVQLRRQPRRLRATRPAQQYSFGAQHSEPSVILSIRNDGTTDNTRNRTCTATTLPPTPLMIGSRGVMSNERNTQAPHLLSLEINHIRVLLLICNIRPCKNYHPTYSRNDAKNKVKI